MIHDAVAIALHIVVTREPGVQRRDTVLVACSGLHISSFLIQLLHDITDKMKRLILTEDIKPRKKSK